MKADPDTAAGSGARPDRIRREQQAPNGGSKSGERFAVVLAAITFLSSMANGWNRKMNFSSLWLAGMRDHLDPAGRALEPDGVSSMSLITYATGTVI